MPDRPFTLHRDCCYCRIGVVPCVGGVREVRVAIKRLFEGDCLTLSELRRLPSGEWELRRGFAIASDSIPHFIELLEAAAELLPTLPLPPGPEAGLPVPMHLAGLAKL